MDSNKSSIVHIDLDSFYASVECLYNPEIRHLPVAVGGDTETRHGIILAKNQIAKNLGVKTGDSVVEAMAKAKNLVCVRADFRKYLMFSRMAKEIYRDYTNKIEPFGIDEAWLDLSGSTNLFGSTVKIVQEIQERINKELGITASCGVSYNKVFAKLGSDQNKPYGLFVVTKNNYKEKIWKLPVSDLLYVGRATTKKLNLINIKTIGDLANADTKILRSHLGKNGEMLKSFANGEDKSIVGNFGDERFIKSIGNSLTLPRDIYTDEEVFATFHMLSESVATRLRSNNLKCGGIQISIRDTNLNTLQLQGQLHTNTFLSTEIANKAFDIFRTKYNMILPIRSVGVKCIELVTAKENIQLNLLEDNEKREKMEKLEKTIDSIRDVYGYEKIQKGILLVDRNLTGRNIKKTNVIFPPAYVISK